jgi:hypothetical protein
MPDTAIRIPACAVMTKEKMRLLSTAGRVML